MSRSSLRSAAARSVAALGASGVAAGAFQYVQLAVLARLLAPEHFGVMGLAIVVLAAADAIADLGLGAVLIHRQDADDRQLSTLFWAMSAGGLATGLLIWLAAPPLGLLLREPLLAPVLRQLWWTVPVATAGAPFLLILQRELKFGRVAGVEIAGAGLGAAAGIAAATAGAQLGALVLAYATRRVVVSVGSVVAAGRFWRPSPQIDRDVLSGVARFGRFQMGDRLLNQWSSNVDYVVVGAFLGAHVLGLYRVAYELVLVPVYKVAPVISRVAFPVFARRQDDDAALQRGFLEMTRLLGFLLFPALVGGAVLAPGLVPLVLGSGWEGAIPIVQILAVVGATKALGNSTGSLLLAKGRADISFYLNVVAATAYTLSFLVAVRWGVMAVAGTFAVVNVAYLFLSRAALFRLIALDWRAYVGALWPFLASSIIMGAGVAGVVRLLPGGPTTVGGVMAGIAIGVALYAALHLALNRSFLVQLVSAARPAPAPTERP